MAFRNSFMAAQVAKILFNQKVLVVDPGKGVCADPVNGGAILVKGGTGPKGGDKERQLSPDRERDKT